MDHVDSFSINFTELMEPENCFHGQNSKSAAFKYRICGIRKMWFAAFASLFISLSLGLVSGYSAPATYDMQTRPNSVIKPTDKQVMWIGSMLAIGFTLGSLIAGPLADKVGRKGTLVYNLLPYGFGWIIIMYSKTIPVLLLGRLLTGISSGIVCVAVPMYCVEIATVEVRGVLGSAFQGFLVIGHLLSVSLGAYISWTYLALNGAIFSVISGILFLPMPESPRYLLMKNDKESAIRVMDDLQGGFLDAAKECDAIYQDLQNRPKGKVTWAELKHPTSIKPGLLTLFVVFFQQFSGINAVFLYSSDVFKVTKDWIDPKIATIILAVVQVFATLISNAIIDKAGRKILLVISGTLLGVSFAIFGAYYYMVAKDATIEYTYAWIPLTCCIVAVIGYSTGYGPIPFLLSAEMLPVRVRSTVSSMVHFFGGAFIFIVTNTFSDMRNLMKDYGTFWFYSTMSAIGVIYVVLLLPETKGKKLEEIQDLFYKRQQEHETGISVKSRYRF